MRSDRAKAKDAITRTSSDDPELDSALTGAQNFELKSREIEIAHKERLKDKEMGVLGRFFGDAKTAPISIAFIAMSCGLLLALGALAASPFNSEVNWGENFERCLAFSGASLAYIFGKNAR